MLQQHPEACIICKADLDLLNCQNCLMYYCKPCLQNVWQQNAKECLQCSSKDLIPFRSRKEQKIQKIIQSVDEFASNLKCRINQKKEELVQYMNQHNNNEPIYRMAPYQNFSMEMINCQNYKQCRQKVDKQSDIYCSDACKLFEQLLPVWNKKDWSELRTSCQRMKHQGPQPSDQPVSFYQKFPLVQFKIIQNIQPKYDQFTSYYGNHYFVQGCYYWEVAYSGKLKIGVSKSTNEGCFSDFEDGFAYFTIGQLRNNSDSMGVKYGSRNQSGVVGVFLNMSRGTLSFNIDDEYFGIAFKSTQLKKGKIYPAVARTMEGQFELRFPEGLPRLYMTTQYL